MWDQYRRTFAGMQVVILLVTVGAFAFLGQNWFQAAVIFLVMQISAVIGAVWATRLSAMVRRRAEGLPLRVRG